MVARETELSETVPPELADFLGRWVIQVIHWPGPIRLEALLHRIARYPAPLVLESRRTDAVLGRYTYLTADPLAYLSYEDGHLRAWTHSTAGGFLPPRDPFSLLAAMQRSWRGVEADDSQLPPFAGGWAGWFGYELGSLLEPVPVAAINDLNLPWLGIGLYDWCLVIDRLKGTCRVVLSEPPGQRLMDERRRWLEAMLDPETPEPKPLLGLPEPAGDGPPEPAVVETRYRTPVDGLWSDFSPDSYLQAVRRVLDYIRAGDIYQANLSQRLLTRWDGDPLLLYLRLRRTNPSFFAAFHRWGRLAVVSCSPEQFLRLRQDRTVETRPIKGTRSRWPYPEADFAARLDLASSEKDRAENVMIVDLLRNDLGRVCEFGSVKVSEPLRVYSFPYVHHLVSTVVGRLRPELTAADLLRAAFPGGSITGAPKVRAMQIIAELEPTVRGPYCGAIGFLSLHGCMETSIAIRTMACTRGWVQLPVGGGIVADSDPESEYEETWHKARGMLTALTALGQLTDTLSGVAH